MLRLFKTKIKPAPAGLSLLCHFFESELIRMGKGKEYNFSEMFVARKAYPLKSDNYVRMHGKANIGEGGGFL